MYVCMYIYVCIYIGAIIWSKVGLFRCYYLVQVCFSTRSVKQRYHENRCVSTALQVLLSGSSWPFLRSTKLGPDNNTYLDQITTPENVFCAFVALKCAEIPIFTVLFENQPNFGKQWAKQQQRFTFCKTQVIKRNRFVATPLLTKNWCFYCFFSKIDVEQKTQLTIRRTQR